MFPPVLIMCITYSIQTYHYTLTGNTTTGSLFLYHDIYTPKCRAGAFPTWYHDFDLRGPVFTLAVLVWYKLQYSKILKYRLYIAKYIDFNDVIGRNSGIVPYLVRSSFFTWCGLRKKIWSLVQSSRFWFGRPAHYKLQWEKNLSKKEPLLSSKILLSFWKQLYFKMTAIRIKIGRQSWSFWKSSSGPFLTANRAYRFKNGLPAML